jgi:hypothetical protein
VYGKGGGGVVCVRHNIVSAVSHTYKQHVFYMIVFSASSRLKPPFVPEARERLQDSARSVASDPSLNPSLAPADVADHPTPPRIPLAEGHPEKAVREHHWERVGHSAI